MLVKDARSHGIKVANQLTLKARGQPVPLIQVVRHVATTKLSCVCLHIHEVASMLV